MVCRVLISTSGCRTSGSGIKASRVRVLGIQAVILGFVILWFRSGDVLIFARNFLNFAFLEGSMDGFMRGAKNTIILAFGGELLGIVIGLSLAMLMISKHRTVRAPAIALHQLLPWYTSAVGNWRSSAPSSFLVFIGGTRSSNKRSLSSGMNMGAYSAEVFRAGIQSVEKGQTEAARSLGLSYVQSMGYVIVPQAVRRVIPPLMNEFVILIKDTSLVLHARAYRGPI